MAGGTLTQILVTALGIADAGGSPALTHVAVTACHHRATLANGGLCSQSPPMGLIIRERLQRAVAR